MRPPGVLTSCQGYLLAHPDMLGTLLAHGMSPDLMNFQRQTLLHRACEGADDSERTVACATLLLDAGADITARDDEYRSTPLAWAERRGHARVASILRASGAVR